jgi:hypothetical protein
MPSVGFASAASTTTVNPAVGGTAIADLISQISRIEISELSSSERVDILLNILHSLHLFPTTMDRALASSVSHVCNILGIEEAFRAAFPYDDEQCIIGQTRNHINTLFEGKVVAGRVDVFIVEGYPGSGKTRSLVEIAAHQLQPASSSAVPDAGVLAVTFNHRHNVEDDDKRLLALFDNNPQVIIAARLLHAYSSTKLSWTSWLKQLVSNPSLLSQLRHLLVIETVVHLISKISQKSQLVLLVDECLLPATRDVLTDDATYDMMRACFQLQNKTPERGSDSPTVAVIFSSMASTFFEARYHSGTRTASGSQIIKLALKPLSTAWVQQTFCHHLNGTNPEFRALASSLAMAHPTLTQIELMTVFAKLLGGLPRAVEAAYKAVSKTSDSGPLQGWSLTIWLHATMSTLSIRYGQVEPALFSQVLTGSFVTNKREFGKEDVSLERAITFGRVTAVDPTPSNELTIAKSRAGMRLIRLRLPSAILQSTLYGLLSSTATPDNRLDALSNLLSLPFRTPRNYFEELIARVIIIQSWWSPIPQPHTGTLGDFFHHARCTTDFPETNIHFPQFQHELQVWDKFPRYNVEDIEKVIFKDTRHFWHAHICEPSKSNEAGVDLCLILPQAGSSAKIPYIAVGLQMKRTEAVDTPTLHDAWLDFMAHMTEQGWPEEKLFFVFVIWGKVPDCLYVRPDCPTFRDSQAIHYRWNRIAILSLNSAPPLPQNGIFAGPADLPSESSLYSWLGPTLYEVAENSPTLTMHGTPHTDGVRLAPEVVTELERKIKEKKAKLAAKYAVSRTTAAAGTLRLRYYIMKKFT